MTDDSRFSDSKLEQAMQCPLLEGNVEQWIRCCTARFLPVARRIAGEDSLARDALQESWIIVLQKLYQYRGGPPACSWVRAIVRHETIHRSAKRWRDVPLNSTEQSDNRLPDAGLHAADLRRVLLAAINHLPATFREVVILRDIEERPNAEVAERLHISKRNAAVRLHRAHRLLRRRLEAHRASPSARLRSSRN